MAIWSSGNLLHVQAQPTSKLKDPATFKIMGQPVAARRYSRPRSPAARPTSRTCGCRAWCMRVWCGRRATARELTEVRHIGGRKTAGRRQGRPRRQFPRRGRQKGIPGRQGDAGAVGRREVEGDSEPAEAGRSAACPHQPAVAGLCRFSSKAIRRLIGAKDAGSDLYAAIPVAWLDRAVLRGRAVGRRHR